MRFGLVTGAWLAGVASAATAGSYPIAGTGQLECYGNAGEAIACRPATEALGGQDGMYGRHPPPYVDHGDGTVSDPVTGLTWARVPSAPVAFADLEALARASRLGGHADWRVPTIRELFSLIRYDGGFTGDPATSKPYLDTSVFAFAYGPGTGLGSAAGGRRPIDVQEWSATRYVGTTMGRDASVFGVNFADGRIKAYPLMDPANRMRTPNRLAVRLVRGPAYGVNDFRVSADTVHDAASGLTWQRRADGTARRWQDALAWCGTLRLDGRDDWRLPDAKELHSIVDYGRIPAIDPAFDVGPAGAYLWSSTTHLESPPPAGAPGAIAFRHVGELAVYAAIGPALGYVEIPPGSGRFAWTDVHGAGAMRSDPKTAEPGRFPQGFGPQGDDVRGAHAVLCVRGTSRAGAGTP